MNGYVKKQALMDYCSNQVTRTIDLNDIARFPIVEIYTKADVVAMLTEIQLEIEKMEQHYQDRFLESKNAVHEAAMSGRMFACGECKYLIQQKIEKLKEQTDGTDNN